MNYITVILTCYNRKIYTVNCIKSLVENNNHVKFNFIVVDDCSIDGTGVALRKLPYNICILKGTGSLFWNGGMYHGVEYLQVHKDKIAEYVLLVNDDVEFYPHSIEKLIELQRQNVNCVCVGTMCDQEGQLTYGGIRFTSKKFIKYYVVSVDEEVNCDTFNANCVLIPQKIFEEMGNFDKNYTHSLGDFDYGLRMKNKGIQIKHSKEYTGVCNENSIQKSWRDTSLKRSLRLRLKESPKGLPYRDWFYFGRKNFGLFTALYHFVTPYIRILIGK